MRDAATIIQHVGFLLYALPTLWCTFALYRHRTAEASLPAIRSFKRIGPLLGLSMGACILGTLSGIWLEHGEYEFRWATPTDQAETAMYITFFAVWVSNIKLEIWTLEPLRKLDPNSAKEPALSEPYTSALQATKRHLTLHAVGLISVMVLRTGL